MYQLPPLPEKKKPRPALRKSDAVKELERLYIEDHQFHDWYQSFTR